MQSLIDQLTQKIKSCLNEAKIDLSKCRIDIRDSNIKNIDYAIVNMSSIARSNNKDVKNVCGYLIDNLVDENYDVAVVNNIINFKYKSGYVCQLLEKYNNLTTLIDKTNKPLNVIVEYSSPNIAKDMHVGHLRSTIIGDVIANVHDAVGNNVTRINHLGDIGLNFGMIIGYIILNNMSVEEIELQKIYIDSKKLFETDAKFKASAYEVCVKLQQKTDIQIIDIWEKICNKSKKAYYDIYNRLSITNLKEVGESFYSQFYKELLEDLSKNNMLVDDDGRMIILVEDSALTVVKSDGGFTYDTSDLAAIKYRLTDLKADRIYHVVDSGQGLHFKQIFEVANKMGWVGNNQKIEHINFGIIRGLDNKRIKSRNGDNPKLCDLLDQSVDETKKVFSEKNKNKNLNSIGEDNYNKIIETVAYGSIKYADLSLNRTGDYIFSFDKMLQFEGNTLAYIMFAYVRAKSILSLASPKWYNITNKVSENDFIDKDYEVVMQLFKLPDILESTIVKSMPHYICSYLFETAKIIHANYKKMICVDECHNRVNQSRYVLFSMIEKVLRFCFNLLGIKTIDKM